MIRKLTLSHVDRLAKLLYIHKNLPIGTQFVYVYNGAQIAYFCQGVFTD